MKIRHFFILLNIFIISTIAYFCVEIFYKNIMPEHLEQNNLPKTAVAKTGQKQVKQAIPRSQYDIILKRNLFKTKIKEAIQLNTKTEDIDFENLEETQLQLRLLGTVTGTKKLYAVIENKKNRTQKLYSVGDSILGAVIKKILRHKVILVYKGKEQVLTMETEDKKRFKAKKPISKKVISKKPISKPGVDNKTVNNISLENINLDELSRQVEIKPHFAGGKIDGFMVYKIKSNSVVKKLGFREGDIIKNVNGTPLESIQDAFNIYNTIKNDQNADTKITFLRKGKKKQLSFKGLINKIKI